MDKSKLVGLALWCAAGYCSVAVAVGMSPSAGSSASSSTELETAEASPEDVASVFVSSRLVAQPAASMSAGSLGLNGIIYSTEPTTVSRAMFNTKDGLLKSYVVGSTLPNGGKLTEIGKRHVTFEVSGEVFTLDLPINKS